VSSGRQQGKNGLDTRNVLGNRLAAELDLEMGVTHLGHATNLVGEQLAVPLGIRVTATRISRQPTCWLSSQAPCQKAPQRLTCNLCRRIPEGHVKRAHGYAALTMASGLLILHHHSPSLEDWISGHGAQLAKAA
jgi:hypothetical protein